MSARFPQLSVDTCGSTLIQADAKFEKQIIKLLAQGVPARNRQKIHKELHLHSDLGIDSLGMIALMFRLQQTFGLELTDVASEIDVHLLHTVNDVIALSWRLVKRLEQR